MRLLGILVIFAALVCGCGHSIVGVPYTEPEWNEHNAYLHVQSPAEVFLIDDHNCRGESYRLTPGMQRITLTCSEPGGDMRYYSINSFSMLLDARPDNNYRVEAERALMTWRAWITDGYEHVAAAVER